jgi:hypothetical protein
VPIKLKRSNNFVSNEDPPFDDDDMFYNLIDFELLILLAELLGL